MSDKAKPIGWTMSINDPELNEKLNTGLTNAIAENPLMNKNNYLQSLIIKGLNGSSTQPIIKEVEKIVEVEKIINVDDFINELRENTTFVEILKARISNGLNISADDLVHQCIDFALRYNNKNYDDNKKRIKDFGFAVPQLPVYEPNPNHQNFYDKF